MSGHLVCYNIVSIVYIALVREAAKKSFFCGGGGGKVRAWPLKKDHFFEALKKIS